MATKKEIEEAKRKLHKKICEEFFEKEVDWNIKDLMRKKKYIDIRNLLFSQILYQNIEPTQLMHRIENGATIEEILATTKEAVAKIGKIYELMGMCTGVDGLDK